MTSLTIAVLTVGGRVALFIVGGAVVWFGFAMAAAAYGTRRGYPFFPLFVSGLVPALGWPVVLLAVTIAAGPHGRRCPTCHRLVASGLTTCDGCGYDFVERTVYTPGADG